MHIRRTGRFREPGPGQRFALLVLLVPMIAACSAKNPDALTTANVDDNLAVADSNAIESASSNAAAVDSQESTVNAGANTSNANVDAAVNTLREADSEMNEYCEAEMDAAGEAEDCNEN